MILDELPPTTDDPIFDNLWLSEVIRFGWLSKKAQAKVDSYLKRKFPVSNVLVPFLGEENIPAFRSLMANTDLLVSGSVVHTLFSRGPWNTNTLNLFVDKRYTGAVTSWLIEHGFICKSMNGPLISVRNLCRTKEKRPESSDLSFKQSPIRHGTHATYEQGITFKKKESYCDIRLRLCKGPPLPRILATQNTAFVNLITHDAAFCLLPHATLDLEGTWRQPFSFYRDDMPPPYVLGEIPDQLCPSGLRHVDDGLSFRVPWESHQSLTPSTIGIHSWVVEFDRFAFPRLEYTVCTSARLKHSYILAEDTADIDLLWNALLARTSGENFLDYAFMKLLRD